MSVSSLVEVGYLIRLASDLGYLSAGESARISALRDEAGRLTWSLYRVVGTSIAKPGRTP